MPCIVDVFESHQWTQSGCASPRMQDTANISLCHWNIVVFFFLFTMRLTWKWNTTFKWKILTFDCNDASYTHKVATLDLLCTAHLTEATCMNLFLWNRNVAIVMSWLELGYGFNEYVSHNERLPYLKWSIPWYIIKPITSVKARSLAFLTFICWIISAADFPCLLDASDDIFDTCNYNQCKKH